MKGVESLCDAFGKTCLLRGLLGGARGFVEFWDRTNYLVIQAITAMTENSSLGCP